MTNARFVLLLSFLALLLLPAQLRAWDGPQETVRVVYRDFGAYMQRQPDGRYQGFLVEYLEEIARRAHLRLEAVDGKNWPRSLRMLEQGEADLLPGVLYTPERAQKMLFPALPAGNTFITLSVRAEDGRYDHARPSAFNGMRVGAVLQSRATAIFEDFARAHEVAVTVVPFLSASAMLAALRQGEVDGAVVSYLGRGLPYKPVLRLAAEPFYVAIAPHKAYLLAGINAAQRGLTRENPRYGLELSQKYLAAPEKGRTSFTREEESFIKNTRPITVAYAPDAAPLQYQDPQTGLFAGTAREIFTQLEQRSGLRFHYVPMPQHRALELAAKGEIDAIACLTGDFFQDKKLPLRTTRPYLRTLSVRVSRTDAPPAPVARVALQEGLLLSGQVAASLPDSRIVYRQSLRACLDDLTAGRADAVYTNLHMARALLTETPYAGLRMAVLPNCVSDLRIGLSPLADHRLFTILDKCLQTLPDQDIDAPVLAALPAPSGVSLTEFIRQNPATAMGGTVALSALLVALLSCALAVKSCSKRRVETQLYRDALTGLPNLEKFREDCARLLEDGQERYALLMGDMVQFKTVNDQLGFSRGDEVLRAYSSILQGRVSAAERCGRVSSDVFVLLLRYSGWEQLSTRMGQMESALDAWRRSQDLPYKISTVYGAYEVISSEGNDVQRMLDLANYARHEAKRMPNTRLLLYGEQMRQEALLHQELNSRLETALTNGELEAWYQAKVDMRTGSIIGAEALVRWNHPTRGLLTPGSFIPLFERNGMVTGIDLYIFEQTCKALHSWRLRNLPTHTISCNFSRLHFDRQDFPNQLAAIAARYDVPHALLEVEITESAIMKNPEAAWMQIIQLKQMGFKTAIDDFGTGYSSLGLVQMLNADVIKIDRSFVQRDLPGQRAQVVLGNIIRLALELDMAVICEGVETAEQAAILMRLGCFKAQGFFYARPEPEREFEARLALQPF
ncbi:EAL domain-containing protein [Desulfovibrio legallii]|uniref:Diguanylate cyclase (GGDEF) domain-containing protein n=1 Tax=Desulfovibrio legallii TaxID=571438 RepID=A0A1G7HSQ1_9BACT|nr:EAL domain-containing protein [Desulfovibrio legallii]SDF03462.1 diguanylate cyclase (GGDEF) domain-containing protein [Desulfovibrio legallii]